MKTPLLPLATKDIPSWYEARFARRLPGFGYTRRTNCWISWTRGLPVHKAPPPRWLRGFPDEFPETGVGFQSHPNHVYDGGWQAQRSAEQRRPGERA